MSAVAVAFEDTLVYNEELVSKVKFFFKKEDLSEPCFKLAHIPSTSRLNYGFDESTGKPAPYPLVSVQNVFIFPGTGTILSVPVPTLMIFRLTRVPTRQRYSNM